MNRLIDDENFIHHLKASETKDFGLWLEHFQQHRFYRQNQINSMSDKDGDPSGIFFFIFSDLYILSVLKLPINNY